MPNEKVETKKTKPTPREEKRSADFEDAVEKLEMHLEEVKADIVDLVTNRFFRE